MRLFVCPACRQGYYVVGKMEELDALLGLSEPSVRCVTPLCNGRMQSIPVGQVPSGFTFSDVPIQTFYRAIHGFGPPSGSPASKKRLIELLQTKRIVDVVAESIGEPERVIVKELVLENGTRLHFETSAKGACIYYIEEPENDPSPSPDPELSHQDREEAGRIAQVELGRLQAVEGGSGVARAPELPDAGRMPSVPEAGDVHTDDPEGCSGPGAGPGMRL